MSTANQLSERQFWSSKLMDLANFSMVSLVFSQIASTVINIRIVGFGLTLYLGIGMLSLYLRKYVH